MHARWPHGATSLATALVCLGGMSCGGRTEADSPFAAFTEIRESGETEDFVFRGPEVQCTRELVRPEVVRIEAARADTNFRIFISPADHAGTFRAAGQSTASELDGLLCESPCAEFFWNDDDRHATSWQLLDSCEVVAELRAGAISASFECRDMLLPHGSRTSIVDGELYCQL